MTEMKPEMQPFSPRDRQDLFSLQDMAVLLRNMEDRLTRRIDDLPAQLEACSKRNLGNVTAVRSAMKNGAHRPPSKVRQPVQVAVKPEILHQAPEGAEFGMDLCNLGSQSSMTALTATSSDAELNSGGTGTNSGGNSGGTPTSRSKLPVWRKIGAKPSETAKAFVRDALTKAQKKKIIRGIQYGQTPLEKEDKAHAPLPGIDMMLDLKGSGTHQKFSETVRGWWSQETEDAMWMVNAQRQAARLKHSVMDLLLSKGWVGPVQSKLSSRHTAGVKLSCSERLVASTRFEMWCSSMILLNAAMLGYQTGYRAIPENDGVPLPWQEAASIIFTVWFSFEVLLRLYAWRLNFFISKDCRWNIFDLTVVSISVIELILSSNTNTNEGASSHIAVVRMIRILRLVRAVRFIRVVRFFAELRMMIYSSLKSVKPFFWALGILLGIIYVFAIVTTQITTDYRLEYPKHDVTTMMKFFGSLHLSIYTLFMVISGGVSWIEPAEELIKIHWSFAIWMSLYVAFVMFAVLNIVTGIFIESALKSAQDDQDVVIQEEMNHEDSLAQGFLEVFERCDDDKSGYIDADEFDSHLSDHRVRAFLHHLGLDIPEAHGLFRLLDIGGTGRVYATEFVLGCQQLKGPAKNVDVATLLFQNKRMMTLWAVFMSYVEDQFSMLVGQSGRLDDNLPDEQDNIASEQTTL